MQGIRLNKQTKTIKVVNRRANLRLQHGSGKMGPAGEKGEKGDTGYSTFNRAHHEADENFPRPDAVYVEWVGSVAPLNATTEDTWVHTIV